MNVLISACLLGVRCRYDGGGKGLPEDRIKKLTEKYHLIPVCPETLGGLPTPREPSERRDGKVFSKSGTDVTAQFDRGAEETLRLVRLYHCRLAILKERSPSCGYGEIYDGTFTGTAVPGSGAAAQALAEEGITVVGESRIESLLRTEDDAK